jgi:aminoglycoside 3'-phosphotransferase-2
MEDFKEFIDWSEELLGTPASVSKEPHGDEGAVFRLETEKGNYYLKVKEGSSFAKEQEKLIWLRRHLPVPEVLGTTSGNGKIAMLLTAIEGKNLKVLSEEWPAEKVINVLVKALKQFHATDSTGWPFETVEQEKVLVHGDACLPNFIFNGDSFSGYIDVGDAALASIEIDLAAAIWSLQYNLGPGFGSSFLEAYGYPDTSEQTVERLRLKYEEYQKAHGFSLT